MIELVPDSTDDDPTGSDSDIQNLKYYCTKCCSLKLETQGDENRKRENGSLERLWEEF